MGSFLERLERNSPNFWALIGMSMLVFISLDKYSVIYNHNTSSSYTEQIISKIRSGSDPTKQIVIIQTSQGKRKKINMITHRRLERFFPDWEERIAYQEDREKVYKVAMIKRREALRLRKKENFSRTKDEQDAIDYFLGRGFYELHQDPSVKPNIFDNRQSFLIKVHDKEIRRNFLKNFNKGHNLVP